MTNEATIGSLLNDALEDHRHDDLRALVEELERMPPMAPAEALERRGRDD